MIKPSSTRRRFVQGTAATAAIAPFFIGRAKAADGDVHTLIASTVAPSGTPWSKLLKQLTKLFIAETGGAVKFKKFFGAAGGEKAILKKLISGHTAMAGLTTAAMASLVPEVECLELPYLFPGNEDLMRAYRVLDKVREPLREVLAKYDLSLICYSANGFRHIFNKGDWRVETPADLKGRKMRSQQSDVHLRMWEAMGAQPVPLSITDVHQALETNLIEGVDNTPLFMAAANLLNSVNACSLTGAIMQPAVVVASNKALSLLPPEVREVILRPHEKIRKYEERGLKTISRMKDTLQSNLVESGIDIIKPDIAKFREVCLPVHDTYKKQASKSSKAFLKTVMAAL